MNIIETVTLAREGNTDAISALYNEYKNKIYFICLDFMRNEEDAGIVLQYTFFQAFHKLAVLKNPENFGMWLYIIAANRCRVLLREKEPAIFVQPDENERSVKNKFNFKNNAEVLKTEEINPGLRDIVTEVIRDLPDIQRMSFVLFFLCRLNLTQIAKILEYDESAIKAHLIKAASLFKSQAKDKLSSFENTVQYENIHNSGILLESKAQESRISDDLSENIVATSATLAASALANIFPEEKEKSQNKTTETATDKVQVHKTNHTPEQRAALRNVITIAVVLILTATVITGSAIAIKKAADSIAMSTGISTDAEESTNTESPSSENITESPQTEPPQTEPPQTEPPQTESPQTEPPQTESPQTESPQTEPPQTEPPGEELTISFDSNIIGNEVIISKYKGTAGEVDIPSSIRGKPVTKIASYAFQDNTQLLSVKIPSSVKIIGAAAFRGCTSLTSVTFSEGLTTIEDYAFLECSMLTSLKVPSSVTSVGVSIFGSTPWLASQETSFLTVGHGILLKYMGTDSEVTVPNGVKYISNAFYYKSGVTDVVLPSGVASIGTYAFCMSPHLKSITFPDTITSINKNAVYGCAKLTEIKVKADSFAESWFKENGFSSLLVTY